MRLFYLLTVCVVFLDQLTKYYVVQILNLKTVGQIDVWPPFLTFRMAWNYGINFGLLAAYSQWTRWGLVAVALFVTLLIVLWALRHPQSLKFQAAAALLVGGAVGNIIDRLWYGAVADFLNTSCCGIYNPYAFNIADLSIFLGAIAVLLFAPEHKKA